MTRFDVNFILPSLLAAHAGAHRFAQEDSGLLPLSAIFLRTGAYPITLGDSEKRMAVSQEPRHCQKDWFANLPWDLVLGILINICRSRSFSVIPLSADHDFAIVRELHGLGSTLGQ